MLGKAVTDFRLASTDGTTFMLSALRGEKLVLYFYPKDDTPGCSAPARTGDLHAQFRRAHARVSGVSRDSAASHERFKERMRFPFELLADPDEAVCKQFGVMKMKNMYGKKVRGIERSTFVVDVDGVLAREWRGVKVPGHAQEVSNFVKAL
jgi:thioredoxin-dependent peroxiredoxin